MTSTLHLVMPKFVDGVVYERTGQTINFTLNQITFALDLDTIELVDAVVEVCGELALGRQEAAELATKFNARLQPYGLNELLSILCNENILYDAKPGAPLLKGNSLFYQLKSHVASDLLPRYSSEPGVLKFHLKTVTKDELRAWSVQYYFVTRFAEQCVVGALNHSSNDALRRLLEEFFVGEVGHDKLLERSLIGFGYSEAAVQNLSPHISTVAMMGMLLRTSIFDIPLFITLLGQMEGSEERSRRYIALLQASGLPDAAIAPQITHEMINIEHDHFGEALEMSSTLPGILSSDIDRCRRQLILFTEMKIPAYASVFAGTQSRRYMKPADFRQAWSKYRRQIARAVLPIAAANAPEALARKFARDFVELHKIDPRQWNPDEKLDVAGAILEHALWKTAYQEPARLQGTLAWLDESISNVASDASMVPQFYVDAFSEVEEAVPATVL